MAPPFAGAMLCALLCALLCAPTRAGEGVDNAEAPTSVPAPAAIKITEIINLPETLANKVLLSHWFPAGGCSELRSCETCTASTAPHNTSGCIWVGCGTPEEPETGTCLQRGAAARETCELYNTSTLCPALKSPTEEPPHPHSKKPVTHAPRTTTSAPLTGSPEFHPPGFDTASFIGGIVLVLSVQAVVFFIIKFIKSKDSTYQTLAQPPQAVAATCSSLSAAPGSEATARPGLGGTLPSGPPGGRQRRSQSCQCPCPVLVSLPSARLGPPHTPLPSHRAPAHTTTMQRWLCPGLSFLPQGTPGWDMSPGSEPCPQHQLLPGWGAEQGGGGS
ncbi:CD164 sialomucin-like 2 protein isoform X2 [Apus apus]|uniref:CD164 sialomucin-like 2 protein isoform X2 n=1 Tax=Apus apus TaxID=8895 RepID=UPI0021F89F6A|nr:CD164 sialomucin-like 2 protein isoform X2 [Apus apus]